MKIRSETRERAKKADEKESWKTCKSKAASVDTCIHTTNCFLHGYPAHTDQGLWHGDILKETATCATSADLKWECIERFGW